jgi:hypothetical protein
MEFTAKIYNKYKGYFALEYKVDNQTYTLEIAICEKNKHWQVGKDVLINIEVF